MLERSDAATPLRAEGAGDLQTRYRDIRNHATRLAAPLSDEDCLAQSMPDASPVKWHLAHTTWFFETFILEQYEADFRPFHQAFRVLFNSYYNGIGARHPRAERGLVTRPPRAEVLAYRDNVDARICALLARPMPAEQADTLAGLVELGLQHEQQHQELLLTDVKHLLSCNPIYPVYDAAFARATPAGPLTWRKFPAALTEIGHGGEGFCFDNELPRHRQFLEPYAIASRLVTNVEYAAFVAAGGYTEPGYWLSEGWDWVGRAHVTQPLYWHGDQEFTLAGLQPLRHDAPALHLNYFEASAYATFAGARLPTEAEWEHAAQSATQTGGLEQLFGTAWQWTSSGYAPYPGFAAAAGAVGEYNGKFMVNQYVLRGSSLATPDGHSRSSYRNFFPTDARWQFSGIRLAR